MVDQPDQPDLVTVARDLYGAAPSGFVASRAAAARAARQAGDRALATAIGALRRPTTAAAAVNLLVRERPDVVGGLLDLGVRLREAQAALAGPDLRALHAEQQRAMAEVVPVAAELVADGGPRAGAAARAQVEATLRAAMGDPHAAAAVATGLLVRDLFSSGLEPVDVTGAVAVEDAPPLAGAPVRRTPLRVVPDRASPAPQDDPGHRPPRRHRGRLVREEPAAPGRPAPAAPGRGTSSARRAEVRQADARQADVRRAAARAEARRAADEDVALARSEAEARRAARDDADARQRAAESRADELATAVRRTTAEIARLRSVLAEAERDARAAGLEVRHARSARTSAARAAEHAESRLHAAEQARSGLGEG